MLTLFPFRMKRKNRRKTRRKKKCCSAIFQRVQMQGVLYPLLCLCRTRRKSTCLESELCSHFHTFHSIVVSTERKKIRWNVYELASRFLTTDIDPRWKFYSLTLIKFYLFLNSPNVMHYSMSISLVNKEVNS